MTRINLLYIFAIILALVSTISCGTQTDKTNKEEGIEQSAKWQNIKGALDYEREVTKDPATGEVPPGRLFEAYKYAKKLQKEAAQNAGRSSGVELHEAKWQSHGPNNVGGRTRAIHIDLRDSERNKIWVGGVTGGLWVSEDITQPDPQWKLVDDFWESISIGAIAQDPGNPEVMYVGTGEGYTGDMRGVGVFKSSDGGDTWNLLPAPIGTAFRYIQDIVVKQNGDVYAGTWSGGLFRSTDGGSSWFRVLSDAPIHDLKLIGDLMLVSSASRLYRSSTGALGDFENISSTSDGFPSNLDRVEFAVCPSDPDLIYIIGRIGSNATNVYSTNDGGDTWFQKALPTFLNNGEQIEFTRGQAWYDLDLAVNPNNCFQLLAGGVPLAKSGFQGNNWEIDFSIHVDHHGLLFDPSGNDRAYLGNDGGIWYTDNVTQFMSNNNGLFVEDKSGGYITTQFYSCALHPDPASYYMIGGTQDNNSLKIDSREEGPAERMLGGDGVFAFIDQNEPNIQIVSSQFGNYRAYTQGFQNIFSSPRIEASVNGNFINVSDYDDKENILYGQTNSADFFRWNINTVTLDYVDIEGITTNVSSVFVDPSIPNRIYFGTRNSQLIQVSNANEGTSVQGKELYNFPGSNTISCVHLDKSSGEDILVTFSNFGLPNNVFISRDAGVSFTGIEGNLPDMPVRWAMFDPGDHNRAIIGTEAGLWTTEFIDGDNTIWTPSSKMPLVPVRMLQFRESDNVVLGATYGRGLFTSNLFAVPAAVIKIPRIVYLGQPILADASNSILASSYNWDFGDGTESSEEKIEHTYKELGKYQVSLTINSELVATTEVFVLPTRPLPYNHTEAEYGGGFESNILHFGAYSDQGSVFSRGKSSITGKNGTENGENAYVLGINEPEYAANTRAYLYTPGFDFSDNTLYSLSFYSRFLIQNPFDGFKMEYTTDYGNTWRQLGDRNDPNWYNYLNQNIERGIFDQGESYFTHIAPGFQKFSVDVSELSGEPFVGFRFVFKSDDEENNVGVAIDDFEIEKFEGEPETEIVNQNAEYTGDSEMTITWSTFPEYQAEKFEIERSFNGLTYDVIKTVNATGKNTLEPQDYTLSYAELRPLLFFRIRSINTNDDIDYSYNFYSPTMVVRRNIEENTVNKIFPNPFTDQINVTFTSVIQEEVKVELFDTAGRLLYEQLGIPGDVIVQLQNLSLPNGLYLLNVKIGDQEDNTYKLFSGIE